MRMRSLFRLDRDQAVPSLPFLIRILPIRYLKKEMVIRGRLVIVAQVVVGSGAQEITYRNFREVFGAHIERFDGERVVLRLVRSEGEIAVGRSKVGLELHSGDEL